MLKYLCICDRCGKEKIVKADRCVLKEFFPNVGMDNRFCGACEKSRAELDDRLLKANDDAFQKWLTNP